MTIDKQCGAGAVNTTYLVAFQESAGLSNTAENVSLTQDKSSSK